jgi:hypothetical protein
MQRNQPLVNKLITAAVVSLTLFATACGDSDSSDATTAPAASEAAGDTTADTTGDTAAADDTAGGDASGTLQEQVATKSLDLATAAGVEVDEDCVRTITAQLSDADAQMILDSYDAGTDVTVSPEGEALGQQMSTECVISIPTT